MVYIEITLWLSIVLLIHNHVLFPLYILLKSRKKKLKYSSFQADNLPHVSVLIAAHNEEQVIAKKLKSLIDSNYPLNKLEILVGSDNSTDSTNSIVKNFQDKHPEVGLIEFHQRTGKPKIIDYLKDISKHPFLILTDANVFFEKDTIYELVRYYSSDKLGLVGSYIRGKNASKSGISIQEKTYLNVENEIKYGEGVLYGKMMGAFGGAYSIRKSCYREVPDGFIADDFFISMNVLIQGKDAILNKKALTYEDLGNNIKLEFGRKVRIATGNFQNLGYFFSKLLKSGKTLSLFFSHKLLRWIAPMLLILVIISSIILYQRHWIYQLINFFNLTFYGLIPIDWLLKKCNIHLKLLRSISHFVSMNVAMLVGFFKFLRKPKSNIWSPTQRNQDL